MVINVNHNPGKVNRGPDYNQSHKKVKQKSETKSKIKNK